MSMNRTDRLIAMVLLLHSRKITRARDMAEHFGIAIRTVYRDMKALNEAGVPIAAESGEGYSLLPGYHLPPVMFTREEAVSLYLGAELTRHLTDASLTSHTDSALMKILAVLPDDQRAHLEKLKDRTHITTRAASIRDGFRDDTLSSIQDALVRRRVLSMDYYSTERDATTERRVEPLGLVFYANYWHLIAYCRLRKDIRDFRTDRVKRIFISDEKFDPPKDFSLKEYLERDQRLDDAEELKIKFDSKLAGFVRDRHNYGIIHEQKSKGGVIFTFLIPINEFLIGWLLSFGEMIEIISPSSLHEALHIEAEKLVKHYKNSKGN